jgi:hypothetical protein
LGVFLQRSALDRSSPISRTRSYASEVLERLPAGMKRTSEPTHWDGRQDRRRSQGPATRLHLLPTESQLAARARDGSSSQPCLQSAICVGERMSVRFEPITPEGALRIRRPRHDFAPLQPMHRIATLLMSSVADLYGSAVEAQAVEAAGHAVTCLLPASARPSKGFENVRHCAANPAQ